MEKREVSMLHPRKRHARLRCTRLYIETVRENFIFSFGSIETLISRRASSHDASLFGVCVYLFLDIL